MLKIKSTNKIEYTLTDKDTGNEVTGATVTAKIREGFNGPFLQYDDEDLEIELEEEGMGIYLYTLEPDQLSLLQYGNVYYFEFTSTADGVTLFDLEKIIALA